MSHGGGEEENYWPGYVDALTSMVQVLAFVMMMLAMAVFVLSQNVAKSAVEAIAKAVNAEVKPDTNVKQLTEAVIEKLGEMRKTSSDPGSSSGAAPPAEASVRSEAERVTRLNVGSQRTQTEHVPIQVPADAPRVTVAFEDKSFRLEKDRADSVVKFIGETKAIEKAELVVVNAYAYTGDGALTEARRLAYYRGMMARKQLIDAKVPAENIRISVLDTTERTKGSTVEIVAAGAAKQ